MLETTFRATNDSFASRSVTKTFNHSFGDSTRWPPEGRTFLHKKTTIVEERTNELVTHGIANQQYLTSGWIPATVINLSCHSLIGMNVFSRSERFPWCLHWWRARVMLIPVRGSTSGHFAPSLFQRDVVFVRAPSELRNVVNSSNCVLLIYGHFQVDLTHTAVTYWIRKSILSVVEY